MNMDQWAREEDDIAERLASGLITRQQYETEMRELRAAYRESAEDAARDAYDREMENWR